jgi:predicted phosphodiesterase
MKNIGQSSNDATCVLQRAFRISLATMTSAFLALAISPSALLADEATLHAVDFESYKAGKSILEADEWKGFEGFRGGSNPTAIVQTDVGVGKSKGLAVFHTEQFRTDNWGVRTSLSKPVSKGVVWIQCSVKLPKSWKGGLFFDMRGPKSNQVIARIAAAAYLEKDSEVEEIRWHSVFNRPYWRLYTKTPIEDKWHKLTARIDFTQGTYACWADAQTLGDDLPLTSDAPFSQIQIGVYGSPDDPAVIDDLIVSRKAPAGFKNPKLLPDPEDDLVFRFAATGDPQLGFTSIETDIARFAHATKQINRSNADLTLMLGDMVHRNTDLKAYEAMQELVKGFKKSYHYVRGNHDIPELFIRYFYRELHYSVVNKGVRFVIIDAEGNHAGMSDKQLNWVESEFKKAEAAGEDIVIASHVSPWQNNERGRGKYNQIGKGRDRLRELMKKHKVLLSLSGHYHRALWHAREEETHYLTLGGTALVKAGGVAWCVFDVYPDRIVIHQKPLFFGYETKDVKRIHTGNNWLSYKLLKAQHPYAQQGPLTIKRHRPVANK